MMIPSTAALKGSICLTHVVRVEGSGHRARWLRHTNWLSQVGLLAGPSAGSKIAHGTPATEWPFRHKPTEHLIKRRSVHHHGRRREAEDPSPQGGSHGDSISVQIGHGLSSRPWLESKNPPFSPTHDSRHHVKILDWDPRMALARLNPRASAVARTPCMAAFLFGMAPSLGHDSVQ